VTLLIPVHGLAYTGIFKLDQWLRKVILPGMDHFSF